MSNPFGSDAAQLISSYASSTLVGWLQIGASALLAYEYLITFEQEVTLFWKHKITGATVLFMATRYIALLEYDFLVVATFFPTSDQSCATLQRAQSAIEICQYLFWAAFSGLRVLALSGMNKLLAIMVFALASAPFFVNAWPLVLNKLSGTTVPLLGCSGIDNLTVRQVLIGVIVARSCSIVADMVVVIVTWLSWRRSGARNAVLGVIPTLSNIIMYNGTIYFIVVVLCNTLHLALTVISIVTPLDNISVVTALTEPVTAVLICRFLLALQRANQAAFDRNTLRGTLSSLGEDGSGQDTLRFASVVIGSIGDSLEGADEEEDVGDTLEDGDVQPAGEGVEKDASSDSDVRLGLVAREESRNVPEKQETDASGSGSSEPMAGV